MKMKNSVFMATTLLLSSWLAAMPATAADLAQAKASGMVGEQMNGLLGLVQPDAPDEVKALVNSVNAQRQAEYQRIAAKNGVSVDEVAKLTAQKVIGQTASGQFVQTPSGWQQR